MFFYLRYLSLTLPYLTNISNLIHCFMVKPLFLFWIGAMLAVYGPANAQSSFTLLEDSTMGSGMSSNGRYLVGTHAKYTDSKSFLYDRETNKLTWMTEYNTEALEKTGIFMDVSDNGVVCGKSYDPEHTITVQDFDGEHTYPLNVAAVWKDGKITPLPYGDIDLSVFSQSGDGTYSYSISADGRKVVGYYSVANMANFYPLVWTEADGKWTMNHPALPSTLESGRIRAISDDGSIMVGDAENTQSGKYCLVYWKDGAPNIIDENTLKLDLSTGFFQISYSDMSPNGRFIALYVNNVDDYLFDTTTGEARKLPNIEEGRPMRETMAVDNEGNVVGGISFGSVFFGGELYDRPLYYSYKDNRLLDLSYYMSLYASDAKPSIPMSYEEKTQALPYDISADGSFIAGNADRYVMAQQTPKTWLLQVDKSNNLDIPETPSGIKGVSEALGEVTLTWLKDTKQHEGYGLKSYNVYRDSLETISINNLSQDVLTLRQTGLKGHPRYVVEAVYETPDGKTILSPRSNALKVSVPETYDLPLFDDFEKASLDSCYWETTIDYASQYDGIWSTMSQGGLNFSIALNGQVMEQKPYSTNIVSRPMDATHASSVNMSFAFIYGFVNVEGQPLDKDSMAVETTTDNGKTWKLQKQWSIAELCPEHLWNIANVQLEGVAGKLFRMRIRRFGQGAAMYYASIDNVKVDAEPEKNAPKDLFGMLGKDGKSMTFAWKNNAGAYQLNYLPAMADGKYALGNEGAELIAANAFGQDELKLYSGKYLTAVTNTFNFYTDLPQEKGIHAAIVIFEDGKLAREQEMNDIKLNEQMTTILDEPLKIDPSKELKIGVKVYDYDAGQIPLLYAITDKYKAGKSDLYSEDGGQTWQKLSAYYEAQGNPDMGQCVWMISGEITDTPQYSQDESGEHPLAYNVFCNGKQLNTFALDGWQSTFTVAPESKDDAYGVMAYYANGKRSAESKTITASEVTAIRPIFTTSGYAYVDYTNGVIHIDGECDHATLTNLEGVTVAAYKNGNISLQGVPTGVYIVNIYKGRNVNSQKIMVRN